MIYLSYVTNYSENEEWTALSNETRKVRIEDPVHTKLLENKKRQTTRYICAEKENDNWLISQIINGVQNARRHEYRLSGGVTCFPTNRRRTHVSATNRSRTSAIRNETEELSVVS